MNAPRPLRGLLRMRILGRNAVKVSAYECRAPSNEADLEVRAPRRLDRPSLHPRNGLAHDLVAAEQHRLLPVVGLGIELPADGGADRPRLLAQRIAVLVKPVVGPEGLLAAFAVERTVLEGAHGEPRLRLEQHAVEARTRRETGVSMS